jgi:O-antigen ligase
LILIAAAFIPVDLPTGTESRLVDSLLLTVFFVGNWILRMIIVEKRLSLKPSPVNKFLLGFICVVPVSLAWSIIFMDPLVNPANLSSKFVFVQTAAALTIIMLPGAFLLVANHINDLKWLKAMAGIMLLAGLVAAPARLGLINFKPANDEGLFSMWIVGISAGLALFVETMPKSARGALLGLTGAWLYIRFILGISWLAGWLPSFIILGILILRRSKKLLFIGILVGLIFVAFQADYYLDEVLARESEESGSTRLAAWAVNWRVTGKHLLFGTGPAGYAAYYMSYFPEDAMATHNNVIDILAQTGVIGLGLCLGFFFTLAWRGYKLCQRLQGRRDFSEALANIAFGGTVACIIMMIFGDWLFPFVYTQTIAGFDYIVYSWLFMGAIVVLDRLTADQDSTPTK